MLRTKPKNEKNNKESGEDNLTRGAEGLETESTLLIVEFHSLIYHCLKAAALAEFFSKEG
jgi:hypothetical protein